MHARMFSCRQAALATLAVLSIWTAACDSLLHNDIEAAVPLQELGVAKGKSFPTVIWHGMGDSYDSEGMQEIEAVIRKAGVNYVYAVRLDPLSGEDRRASFFGNVIEQIDLVCKELAQIPVLADGFNAVGFSQGGQFLRGYVERCNSPPVRNLVSVGGQHQGVYGIPRCTSDGLLCEVLRRLLGSGPYSPPVQRSLVQAQYWKDPLRLSTYEQRSLFLAEINNERAEQRSDEYRKRMISLNALVLVKFQKDTMVVPKESSWFGFYSPGQDKRIVPMADTDLYIQDWIGLRALNETGRLFLEECDGDHLEFTLDWFVANVVNRYLVGGSDRTES
mmetsp:Transcript_12552/g.21157  ORF Transcript_12552/g.21157 Transcript_12552/m.21157 type:complete len:333 (+) Transcript_12552:26-1024(+)